MALHQGHHFEREICSQRQEAVAAHLSRVLALARVDDCTSPS